MIFEKISKLCAENGISIAELERNCKLGNGVIKRWTKSSPTAENISKVADFFHVSVDFLLGRET